MQGRPARSGDAASRPAGAGLCFDPPLLIGAVSDTHVFEGGARKLPPAVTALFGRFGTRLIVHAGDVCTRAVLDDLGRIAPVLAVRGNGDPADLGLPERIDFGVGRFRFVLLHGHTGRTARRAAAALAGTADCVIYGHSHIPRVEVDGGTILFNPGSPTDRRWHPHFGVGLIEVTEERIAPELILFERAEDLDGVAPGSEPGRSSLGGDE